MHILDSKIEAWRVAYARMKDVRARYKEALSTEAPEAAALAAELDTCQLACGVALDAMQAELARLKDGGDSKGDSR